MAPAHTASLACPVPADGVPHEFLLPRRRLGFRPRVFVPPRSVTRLVFGRGHGRGPAPDVSEVDLTLPALGEREFSRLLDLGLACLDLSYVEMRDRLRQGPPAPTSSSPTPPPVFLPPSETAGIGKRQWALLRHEFTNRRYHIH